jgi:hypothetical protein
MVPTDVLDAFWLPHIATPLMGGQGNSWRVGDYVLKPHEASYEGISLMVNQLHPENFRVSYHHTTIDGKFTFKWWWCTHFEPGEEITGRIREKYAIARELHDIFGTIQKPKNWQPSDSPWSRAHEIVWWERELPTDIHPEIYEAIKGIIKLLKPIKIIEDLEKKVFRGQTVWAGWIQTEWWNQSIASFCPLNAFGTFGNKSTNKSEICLNNQIIHGDLCWNILFHATLPPVVIDFSLDYRPREYAEAILIADSIAWEHGGEEAYSLLPPNSEQVLLRACLFRLITKALLKPKDVENFRVRWEGYRKIIQKISK